MSINWSAGYPLCELFLSSTIRMMCQFACLFLVRARDNESDRETFPTSVSSQNSRSGVLVRSVEFMCYSGPEGRGG